MCAVDHDDGMLMIKMILNSSASGGTQFTTFTSTKVQILTRSALSRCLQQELCAHLAPFTQFTCVTSTHVQILTPEELQHLLLRAMRRMGGWALG